jgi:Arc/MetJ family transcription regulator
MLPDRRVRHLHQRRADVPLGAAPGESPLSRPADAGPLAIPKSARRSALGGAALYTQASRVYTGTVTKRLIDVDDVALDAARAELGTRTIKDTVNEALRRAAAARRANLDQALDVLASAELDDRSTAWR